MKHSRTAADYYIKAKALVIKTGWVTSELLQTNLDMGYANAMKLIDMFEDEGLIEKTDKEGPKQVLDQE